MGLFDRFKRRRRTLNANFSSYRNLRLSNRKPFEPKTTVRSPRKGFWPKVRRFLQILAGLAALIGLLYVLLFTNLFEIQKIDVEGGNDTLEEQSSLNTTLQAYLGKSLLTLNTSQIESELLLQYPYLLSLDVRRSFFHTLTVVLETYPKAANIRIDFEDGTQQIFVINGEGTIATSGEADKNLPTIVMDTAPAVSPSPAAAPYAINQELVPKEQLETLLDSAKNFEGKFNMKILEIHYLKQARELHLITERHFTVWLDLTQDVNLQLTKLKKALTSINIYEADLDYIDLRISGQNGEKVIYHLNGSE